MNSKFTVYLCGQINGCTDQAAREWRIEVKRKCDGINVIDPLDMDYRGTEKGNDRTIVQNDKAAIANSDILIAMFREPSVGASMEILFAYSIGVPVVLINESNRELSPWLVYHARDIVSTIDEAIKIINPGYMPHPRRKKKGNQ
jgi:nucleoside 2-deoxyribosyltransferase